MARLGLLLILIALAIAPVRMFGAGEAAAASGHHGLHQAAAAPCASQAAPEGDAAPQADCMTACAAIAPPFAPHASALDPAPQLVSARRQGGVSGLDPEAEPPPPRFS